MIVLSLLLLLTHSQFRRSAFKASLLDLPITTHDSVAKTWKTEIETET